MELIILEVFSKLSDSMTDSISFLFTYCLDLRTMESMLWCSGKFWGLWFGLLWFSFSWYWPLAWVSLSFWVHRLVQYYSYVFIVINIIFDKASQDFIYKFHQLGFFFILIFLFAANIQHTSAFCNEDICNDAGRH